MYLKHNTHNISAIYAYIVKTYAYIVFIYAYTYAYIEEICHQNANTYILRIHIKHHTRIFKQYTHIF